MIAARSRAGLVATAWFFAPALASAADKPGTSVTDAPVFSFDFGGGAMQPSYGATSFTTLDTFNGQHTYYHSTGASLGLVRPVGFLMNMTAHVYPFSFRGIGFVATGEVGGFTSNLGAGQSPFGPVDPSSSFYASGLIGPEAQARLASLFVRAGVLGGGRYASVGDYSATEWRVALRGQLDYAFGEPRRGETTLTVGVFGGTDLLPAFGWSSGVSVALAFL